MNQMNLGPVDPELFLWCSNVYSAASHLTMPVENPASRPSLEFEGKGYVLSDTPINRGLLAVMKELRDRAVSEDDRMAFSARLMHFGEVFTSDKLRKFMKEGSEPGELLVSEALIRACATARMMISQDRIRFDLEDVQRIAQALTDAEDAADAAAASAPSSRRQ